MAFIRTSHPSGTFITLAGDNTVGQSLREYGEWCFGEVLKLSALLPRIANVLEAGSNIGAHTVFLANRVCPKGRVFAYEPRRLLFQMLCTNVLLNGITNVHAFQLGLGDRHETFREAPLPIDDAWNFGAVSLGERPGEGEITRIVPLDSMIGHLPRIHAIKADVEGHELALLRGAEQVIARDRPILYFENDREDLSPALLAHVDGLGYRMYWSFVMLFREANFAGNPRNVFGHTVACNVLAIPREDERRFESMSVIADFENHPFAGGLNPERIEVY